jgi:hypothetical protein
VKVLDHALRSYDGWISGQKRYQSHERSKIDRVEWDSARGKWKFNPLADWEYRRPRDLSDSTQNAGSSFGFCRVCVCRVFAVYDASNSWRRTARWQMEATREARVRPASPR